MRLLLTQVREIFRQGNKVHISLSWGIITGEFEVPKCGLHLKEGDLVIAHEYPPRTAAIDKVISIEDGALRIRRVLGSFEEVPPIKRNYVEIHAFCS